MLSALSAAGAKSLIVGAHAVAAHGIARLLDLELLPQEEAHRPGAPAW
jgi:hypothetical protein